jgi:hypothetical protein
MRAPRAVKQKSAGFRDNAFKCAVRNYRRTPLYFGAPGRPRRRIVVPPLSRIRGFQGLAASQCGRNESPYFILRDLRYPPYFARRSASFRQPGQARSTISRLARRASALAWQACPPAPTRAPIKGCSPTPARFRLPDSEGNLHAMENSPGTRRHDRRRRNRP